MSSWRDGRGEGAVITILTLLLGLTYGAQPVELAVGPEVAAVELRLDGAEVARVVGPPWVAEVTFGPDLGPWRLEAVARDGEGAEIGRAARWVNLGSGGRAARLWVRREPSGDEEGAASAAATARLVWRSVEHDHHRSLEVTFDGEPLAVDDPGSILLPPHDPDALHLLTARVTLPDGAVLRADAAFGGGFGDEVFSELTAVPVEVEGRRRLLRAEEAGEGWLRVDGGPAPVLAVDHGGADLFVVLDPGADLALKTLGYWLARKLEVPARLTLWRCWRRRRWRGWRCFWTVRWWRGSTPTPSTPGRWRRWTTGRRWPPTGWRWWPSTPPAARVVWVDGRHLPQDAAELVASTVRRSP